MAIDEDINDFMRRMRAQDHEIDVQVIKASDAYRALPAVTHGITELKATGFQRLKPEDDVPPATPVESTRLVITLGGNPPVTVPYYEVYGFLEYDGVQIPPDDPDYTVAFTVPAGATFGRLPSDTTVFKVTYTGYTPGASVTCTATRLSTNEYATRQAVLG